MGKINTYSQSFNVGQVDKKHLVRIDLERLRLAAETQKNLLALTTGPGFMRPGLEYLSSTRGNAVCRLEEFVFGATDAALMEFSNLVMRVRNADVLITRPAVTAAVTNGDFSSGTGWTLTATAGATASISTGLLGLAATARGSRASCTQTVAVNEQGIEHALRVEVARGPVTLRVGATAGGDEYISETSIDTGTHSLAFTPTTANFYIQLQSELRPLKVVDSITVEAAGVMELPTIWPTAALDKIRFAQSADVVFAACRGYRQQQVERRGLRSWSVVRYAADDGPFTSFATRAVKLKVSATEGNGTLTANAPFFNPSHVGALFRLTNSGAAQTFILGGEDQFTDPFRVTGVVVTGSYNDRNWTYTITGTWVGTLRWQRSFDDKDGGYKRFRKAESTSDIDITSNVSNISLDDSDDNSIIWYKIGFEEGSYTSGAATITFDYDGGGGDGICRVVSYTSPTSVSVEIIRPFSGTGYTSAWQEGEWSDNQTWPSAVAFSDGRLIWSGGDRFWASVSDAFSSFDDTVEGDSGPIIRSIATGGVNDSQWMMSLQRLLIGTEGAVSLVKSSSFDEPLTPANNSIKDTATTGAAAVDPAKIDSRGLFVERSGTALMELTFDGANGDYVATQLSKLVTDIFGPGVRSLSVQRRPDTRIWVIMNDGSCVCVIYEPIEEVLAFIPIETDGRFESVAVLPDVNQDRVYFVVNRTISSGSVRYVEKMAMDADVKPATQCKVFDAFKAGTLSPANTVIPVGTHLAGKAVRVWANGAPLETSPGVPVSLIVNGSGNITVPSPVSSYVVGLPYDVRYKSARLAYGAELGTAMLQKKKVDALGFVMTDFVRAGIRYGNPARSLDPLPILKNGITAPAIVLSDVAEEEPFVFPGEWDTDSRVAFEWSSPYTATILGMTMAITTHDK